MSARDPKRVQENREIGPYLNLGLQLAVAVGLGMVLGWWVDKKLNTFPLFLLLGLCIGAVAGFLNIYRIAYPPKSQKNIREKQRNEIKS